MPDYNPTDLKAARHGDEGAFLALYHRLRTPLFHFVWRFTGSMETAEDVVQECFLALLEGASFNAGRGSVRAYLFGIARNLAFQRLRKARRESQEVEGAVALDPANELLTAERSEAVAQAIGELPFLQREAILLFYYEGLPLEEIADIVGAETGAVKARLHRAREALRSRLAPLIPPHARRSI